MNNERKSSLARKLLAEPKSKHDVSDESLKLVLDVIDRHYGATDDRHNGASLKS